ncbi:cytochrome P450 [Nocardia sp. NPDC058480]|uniref:cytochrome P450 n=1 Tax=unclassified Nocardia TaxID=2637762 RepID=UPI0036616E34
MTSHEMPTSTETSLSVQDLPLLDITTPGFTWEGPEVAAARQKHWAARSPVGLLVLRFAEAAELLHDPRLVQDLGSLVERAGAVSGPLHDQATLSLQSRAGTDHRRRRGGLVARHFSAAHVAKMRPFIRATAHTLAEQLATVGPCDFVNAFAEPLPLTVICHLLGIPPGDRDLIHHPAKGAGLLLALDYNPDLLPLVEAGIVALTDYVETLIRGRVAEPGSDGLLSHLLRATQDDNVDERELGGLVVDLLTAGFNTVSHQLSLAMVAFAQHPEQWFMLRERPELAEQAVDEILRYCPTTATIWRRAATDLDYQGLHIPAHTLVHLVVYSAHRDPMAFPDGDTFDIATARNAPLLTFGGGAHFCPGTALSRSELTESLTALTTHHGPPRITGPITWRPPIGVCGPETLPLTFGPP